MIKLRDYQEDLYAQLLSKIEDGYKRILVQAETGWGKSILIGHTANNLKGRTLILTHRIELLEQNSEWIDDLGILTAKVRKVDEIKKCKNVIAMTQTAQARFGKYGVGYLGDFDNIIVDETHVDYFKQVYENINYSLLIGLAATPIIYKKETEKISENVVRTRKLSLADDFDTIIQGIGVNELIDLGFLTRDEYIILRPDNLEKLKRWAQNPDGYASKSLAEVFGSHASVKKVIESYRKREGTKTIVFNPTTKVNSSLHKAFIKEGLGDRVRMFDSVNKSKQDNRNEVVEWFKSTPNAILLNVGVFTTGFNVKDIETVIYNKSTMSLSLWLQSCGRGGRVSKGKKSFTIIDLGLNVEKHGYWSDPRDWSKEFVVHNWETKKPTDLLQVWECVSCGEFNLAGTYYNQEKGVIECGACGEEKVKKDTNVNYIKGELVEVKKPRYPSAKAIVNYAHINGNDANLAFRLLEKQLFNLVTDTTEASVYFKNRNKCINRLETLYRPVYFSIIRSNLVGANKRLSAQLNKLINKLDKYYGK